MQIAYVQFDSWAGRTKVRVEIIGATPKRYRVRFLEDCIKYKKGVIALVPKYSVKTEVHHADGTES